MQIIIRFKCKILYRYFIWWKYKVIPINLNQFKDIYIEQASNRLFLVPKEDEGKYVYLTSVKPKILNTNIWVCLINDIKKNFIIL